MRTLVVVLMIVSCAACEAKAPAPVPSNGNGVSKNWFFWNQYKGFQPALIQCIPANKPGTIPIDYVQLEKLRQELHERIILDNKDFDDDIETIKLSFYTLTASALIFAGLASFFIAIDWQNSSDKDKKTEGWKKGVIVAVQILGAACTTSLATFKIEQTWATRVDGVHLLRENDRQLILNGCTIDKISEVYENVNDIESDQFIFKGMFSKQEADVSTVTTTQTPKHPPTIESKPVGK